MPDKPSWYDEVFDSVRKAWDEHDKTCTSLRYLWLGRPGGVSCLSDLTSCSDCDVLFFNEGGYWINWDVPGDEDEIYLCDCCVKKITVAA